MVRRGASNGLNQRGPYIAAGAGYQNAPASAGRDEREAADRVERMR